MNTNNNIQLGVYQTTAFIPNLVRLSPEFQFSKGEMIEVWGMDEKGNARVHSLDDCSVEAYRKGKGYPGRIHPNYFDRLKFIRTTK